MSVFRREALVRLGRAQLELRSGCQNAIALVRDCIEYATNLEDMLRDVAGSGVELDDERLRYVTVQIDRPTWEALQQWRKGAS